MSMRPAGGPAVRAARYGPRAPRRRRSSQIAEHCNREQFDALIGTSYPGIVVSDRWNGYSHLDPDQRQVCWSHLQRDFRRHADGLGEQKTFGERGLELTARVFAAWRAYQHEHHDRDRLKAEIAQVQTELRQLLQRRQPEEPTHALAPPLREQPAQGLARALDLHHPSPRSSRRITPPSAPPQHRSSTENSRSAPKARPASDSPNAHSPRPRPAASSAARCSPISAT